MIEGIEEVDIRPIIVVHQTAPTVAVAPVEIVIDRIVTRGTEASALLLVVVGQVTNRVLTAHISIIITIITIMVMGTAARLARHLILIFRQYLRFHHYRVWKLELLVEYLSLFQTTLPVLIFKNLKKKKSFV